MEDAEVVATIALSLVPSVGPQRLRLIVSTFGSAQAALAAPPSRLETLEGIGRAAATAITEASARDGERVLEQLAQLGARVLISGDPEFPPQLEEIRDPPPVLYVWGDVSLLARTSVAMVGSRDHSAYGAEAARILASAVAPRAAWRAGSTRSRTPPRSTRAAVRSAFSETVLASSILPPIARCTTAWCRTAAS